jgi:hypothetical protein
MALSRPQFEAIVKPKRILRFAIPELNIPIPHYFICVGQLPEGKFALSCCTSQFNTVRQLIERNRFPESTLVWIRATDADNPFHLDTYVNCNEYFGYEIDELWNMYSWQRLTVHDELPLHSFEQILIGLKDSDQIVEELKENLPSIDDL